MLLLYCFEINRVGEQLTPIVNLHTELIEFFQISYPMVVVS